MSDASLEALSDMITEAHARIQQHFEQINPVVGVRRGMRDVGIPADAMTIDCLQTRNRIVLILHDEQPGVLLYQFGTIDAEAGEDFQSMHFSDVSVAMLFAWMKDSFSS